MVISLIIGFTLFFLILDKFPQYKLFFSLDYMDKKYYNDYASPIYGIYNQDVLPMPFLDYKKNYPILNKAAVEIRLKYLSDLYGSQFILGESQNTLIGMSKYHYKVYRNITHVLYGLLILITTWVIATIIMTVPGDVYFLIPHFGSSLNYLIGFILAIVFPIEIVTMSYIYKRNIFTYILLLVLTIIGIPIIIKFPSAHYLYYNKYIMYTYIGLILLMISALYKLSIKKNFIVVAYISSILTYIILLSIILGNLVLFFN